jgi:hypothetical protein
VFEGFLGVTLQGVEIFQRVASASMRDEFRALAVIFASDYDSEDPN